MGHMTSWVPGTPEPNVCMKWVLTFPVRKSIKQLQRASKWPQRKRRWQECDTSNYKDMQNNQDEEVSFRPGINIHLGWSDHKWTALSRRVDTPKMHWGRTLEVVWDACDHIVLTVHSGPDMKDQLFSWCLGLIDTESKGISRLVSYYLCSTPQYQYHYFIDYLFFYYFKEVHSYFVEELCSVRWFTV